MSSKQVSKRRSYTLTEEAMVLLFQWKLHTGRKYEDMVSAAITLTHLICEKISEDSQSYDAILDKLMDSDLVKMSKDNDEIEKFLKLISDTEEN